MRERRARADDDAAVREQAPGGVEADSAEADDDPDARQRRDFGDEVRMWQAAISAGVGLLSGGAQRTAAAMNASLSASPSSACRDVGMFAKPCACIARIRKSPAADAIAGEDAAGAVGAVRRRREADDEHARVADRRSPAPGGPQ